MFSWSRKMGSARAIAAILEKWTQVIGWLRRSTRFSFRRPPPAIKHGNLFQGDPFSVVLTCFSRDRALCRIFNFQHNAGCHDPLCFPLAALLPRLCTANSRVVLLDFHVLFLCRNFSISTKSPSSLPFCGHAAHARDSGPYSMLNTLYTTNSSVLLYRFLPANPCRLRKVDAGNWPAATIRVLRRLQTGIRSGVIPQFFMPNFCAIEGFLCQNR